MTIKELKEQVFEANMLLPKYHLVTFTWGNVSAVDREKGLMAIKPSGVAYEVMKPEQMVVLDLDGKVVEGNLNPSSDTPTHLVLYRAFEKLGGVVHTHSTCATSFAQAERDLDCFGTTHADYFYGAVPCTRMMTAQEIQEDYEGNTGHVIVETFKGRDIDPVATPAVLVRKHGPFTWGPNPFKAVENAAVLEVCAQMAGLMYGVNPDALGAPQCLMDKHYFRKHGAGAYYGQR